MACQFEITLPEHLASGLDAARRALDAVDALEAQLTVFRHTSEVAHLNRSAATAPVIVEPRLFDLLQHCAALSLDTGGAFDITSTPLSRCWGFMRREGRIPDPDELAVARSAVGMAGVDLDAGASAVRFTTPGLELNLGSIGKGYALDRVARTLAAAGVGQVLLSAGFSSVLARDGAWRVHLRSPAIADRPIARLRLTRAALGTSGAGQQHFEVNGVRYGHVIDPRSGWPARGVLSASAIADDAATADALATAFFVGGVDLARQYCASHRRTMAFVTPDDGSGRPIVIGHHPGVVVETV